MNLRNDRLDVDGVSEIHVKQQNEFEDAAHPHAEPLPRKSPP